MSRYIDYDTWEIIKKNLLENINSVPPVGSVITNSLASFDPNEYYPNTTWVRIKGKVIVGLDENDSDFDTINETGGEKTHTLSVVEMPSHTHTQNAHGHSASGGDAGQHSHGVYSSTAGSHRHHLFTNWPEPGQDPITSTIYEESPVSKYAAANTSDLPYSTRTGYGEPYLGRTNYEGSHSHTIYMDGAGTHSHSISVASNTATNNNTGGSQAHNNLQPYITKYVWERTA